MNHVMCKLIGDHLEIWRDGKLIGTVDDKKDLDPVITMYGGLPDYMQTLTFNDMEIIMDNWNQLKESEGNFTMTPVKHKNYQAEI